MTETDRMIGVSHGYVHALAKMKLLMGQEASRPIPQRYTKRRQRREDRLDLMRQTYVLLEKELRDLQAEIARRTQEPRHD